jgi:hypothetical protein
MEVMHSLASWAADITDSPEPSPSSAEAVPDPEPVQRPPSPQDGETPVEADSDALSELSDLTDLDELGGLASEAEIGRPGPVRDEESPSWPLEFASPSTPDTTPEPGDETEKKALPCADRGGRAGGVRPLPAELNAAAPPNARRVLDLMERQGRASVQSCPYLVEQASPHS